MMKKISSVVIATLLLLGIAPGYANPNYRLKITYQATAAAKPITWQLTCRPAGGTHPAAKLACQEIQIATAPFAKPAKEEACTMIYGGEETAKVTGRWAGKKINRSFSRINGCEISRWDQLKLTLSGKSG